MDRMISTEILTLAQARDLTDEVKADAAALWGKLLRLYEGKAHIALGYSSWGEYYAEEFDQSANYGYRLLKSAVVVAQLPKGNPPVSERVARELVPVLRENPAAVPEVWGEVVNLHGPTPTAAQVREVVREPAPLSPSQKLSAQLDEAKARKRRPRIPVLLAETLIQLRRADDGLRQAESGEQAWVEAVRRNVAQAAKIVESLIERIEEDR